MTAATLRLIGAPALAAVTLAACATSTAFSGSPIISKVDISRNYRVNSLGRFHGDDNAMRVVGFGSPFGDPPGQVAQAVVAGVQGHNNGPRMTFTSASEPPPRPHWRVVMAINPTEIRDTIKLCKLSEEPDAAPLTARAEDGNLKILAAFCHGDYAASQATGRISGVSSLSDPKFDALLARLTRSLFPVRNPHDDRNRRRCRILPCP